MKVEMEPRETEIFLELKAGECFRYDGKTYIVINGCEDNAVCLEDGTIEDFGKDTEVASLPNAKVVCEISVD